MNSTQILVDYFLVLDPQSTQQINVCFVFLNLGKQVSESSILDMKANFSLPEERDNLFDRIDFVELQKEAVVTLVRA